VADRAADSGFPARTVGPTLIGEGGRALVNESLQPSLMDGEPDEVLDVRGETCPFPAMHTQKKLRRMPAGRILEILIDHPPSAEETIPGICAENGWPFVSIPDAGFTRIKVHKTR
jgi:tRNA 2-thiouridine synthesizing protein A